MSSAPVNALSAVGQFITRLRNFVINGVFLILFIVLTVGLLSTCQTLTVPSQSALVINPDGILVDARNLPSGLDQVLGFSEAPVETELQDLLDAIHIAKTDDDIKLIVLNLENLVYASPAQAHRIGQSLLDFRDSGKEVISYGDYYSQAHLLIASHADAVYMHPLGQAMLSGYGGSNLYFKDLLERFGVSVHVFRAGEFKSAVEPFTRNDMSAEARLANEQVFQELWQSYREQVAVNRDLNSEDVQHYTDNVASLLRQAQGDSARMALEAHLVDELLTGDQATVRVANQVGFADPTRQHLNAIDFLSYLQARSEQRPYQSRGQDIAVINVQGPIVLDSSQANMAGANQIVELIRKARFDDSISAVVLRVDSPGGSQFASELIRQELELIQLTGKPVVGSFGSVAASGGYWVVSTAEEIVSEANTITGSIGNFAILTTFENTLAKFGVNSDGVGTSRNTLGFGTLTGINEEMTAFLQTRTENGYEQFVNLVAKGRGQDPEQIEGIAGGRIWSGSAALELGLIDHIGGLQTALERAAALSGLEQWGVRKLRIPQDPRGQILAELLSAQSFIALDQQIPSVSVTSAPTRHTDSYLNRVQRELRSLERLFSDPQKIYAYCDFCLLQ